MNMKSKSKITLVITYAIIIGYCIITFIPFGWAILTSFKTSGEIAMANTFFPSTWTLEGYQKILTFDFVRSVGNSFFVAISVTGLNVAFNTIAGYALARMHFKGKSVIFQSMLLLIMIPAQVTMIPAYIIVSKMGLINTPFSLIITSAVSISYIFLMRQFFINFPKDVEEAAAMDGLNKFQTFYKIVLPMARPALATQAIFTFMGVWNEFMKPLLYIQTPEKYMLTQFLNNVAKQHAKSSSWNITMAGSLLSIIPILVMYVVLNKYFITINDQSSGSK